VNRTTHIQKHILTSQEIQRTRSILKAASLLSPDQVTSYTPQRNTPALRINCIVDEMATGGDATGILVGGEVGIGPAFWIGAGVATDADGGIVGDGFTKVGAFVGLAATGVAKGAVMFCIVLLVGIDSPTSFSREEAVSEDDDDDAQAPEPHIAPTTTTANSNTAPIAVNVLN
jgi:hypothetical protein